MRHEYFGRRQYKGWELLQNTHPLPSRLPSFMRRSSLLVFVLALPPAFAQQPAAKATAELEKEIQRVEVKGDANTYDPRRDDTASKIVVTNEEIRRYGDTSVLDVFKRLPGITVSGAAGRGGEIRMRGLGSGYTQILINGERAPAGFSIDQLAPDVIERIEILRAASAEFSTQSIAGTINIVLKKAIKKAQRELRVGLGKNTHMTNPNASLQLSDRVDDMSYSVSVNAAQFSFDRPSPTEEAHTAPDGRLTTLRRSTQHDEGDPYNLGVAPRLNWNLKDGDSLTWQSLLNVNRNDYHGHVVTDTLAGSPPPYDERDMRHAGRNAILRSDLNWVHNLEEGAKIDAKLGVNGQRNKSTWREHDDSGGLLARDSTVLSSTRERGLSSTGKYTRPWKKDHALAMGWDGGYTLREDGRGEDELFPRIQRALRSDEGYEARIGRLALYAQDEWNLTPRWSMYAGLRWEGLRTTSEGNTFDKVSQRSSVWSPLAQTLYKLPNSRDQLRLALTRTYKAPSSGNLVPRRFTTPNNSQTDPDFRGNPGLKPELATGIDASYEHYWAEKALLSASVSMRRISDFMRQGLILENGRWIQTPVNDGAALTRSLELEAKFPLSALVKAAPDVDLRASLSRNWSRVEAVPGPDNRLDQQTPLSGNLGIDYKTRDGKLTAGSSFAFRSGGPVRINVNQSAYQSVRRDLDVYALWKFNAQYQVRAAMSNLLGQDFTSDARYTDASGTMRRTSIFPGRAMARVTVETRF